MKPAAPHAVQARMAAWCASSRRCRSSTVIRRSSATRCAIASPVRSFSAPILSTGDRGMLPPTMGARRARSTAQGGSNGMAVQRSVLAVPGNNWRMIEKAIASDADVIFLDLEDAVAPDAKAAGRETVIRALTELDWGRKPRVFRINALDTPFCYRDVIEVVEAAGDRLNRIIVPKVNRPEDVAFVDTLLTQIEANRG